MTSSSAFFSFFILYLLCFLLFSHSEPLYHLYNKKEAAFAAASFLYLFLSVIDCSYQRIDRRTDDIRINASSPCKSTIRFADSHIRNRFGCGTALQRMLLISFQCIFQLISFLQCITYCIKTAIAGSFCNNGFPRNVEVT